MAWQKSPPELVALFDAVLPGPPVQRRLMFGYPSGFVNGRLAFGLFEDKIVLRLPPFALDALLRSGGMPFAPMAGRTMKGFAMMPPKLIVDGPGLRGWIQTAVEHAKTLPPKGGEPETEGELPVAAPAAQTQPAAKPAVKAKPKARPKTKRKAAAKPKRAVAAKKPARKPARKVVKKAAKKPVRKALKRPAKKAKPAAAKKAGKAKRAGARKRPAAKRKPTRRAAKRR